MLKNYFKAAFATALIFTVCISSSCTKLDTTKQGVDLLLVDNINTFSEELNVNVNQSGFISDSTFIKKIENHVIGRIDNDVYFGKTEAAIYVQFKPTFYPFYFGSSGDTVKNSSSPFTGLDSAFICLSYRGAYGDTSAAGNQPQTFKVNVINDNDFNKYPDSIRKFSYQPSVGMQVGTASISPLSIVKYTKLNKGLIKDSVNNQIRIPIDLNFAKSIFNGQDSTASGSNNAFYNDSTFRSKFNGFAITVSGVGNTLYYVNLNDTKTRFEFHYKKANANGIRDTVVQSLFMFSTAAFNSRASATSNYIKRNYTGSPASTNTGINPNYIYLQTAPTGYNANISIPGLSGYANKVVHRAFLIVEQDPSVVSKDDIYTPPPYLYADLKEDNVIATNRFKPVYFDLSNLSYNPDATDSFSYFPRTNIDFNNFGGRAMARSESGTGLTFYRYEINITRYVQHIVTNNYKNYDLRLYAPYNIFYPQYGGLQISNSIPFNNPIALGRMRVGGSTNTNHKMRLVVIYSKL